MTPLGSFAAQFPSLDFEFDFVPLAYSYEYDVAGNIGIVAVNVSAADAFVREFVFVPVVVATPRVGEPSVTFGWVHVDGVYSRISVNLNLFALLYSYISYA